MKAHCETCLKSRRDAASSHTDEVVACAVFPRECEIRAFVYILPSPKSCSIDITAPRKVNVEPIGGVRVAQFEEILSALVQGQSVRRDDWEETIRIFVIRDSLMCQYGVAAPWPCALSWSEMAATDWQLIADAAVAFIVSRSVEARPLPFVLRASTRAFPDSPQEEKMG